MKNHSDHVARIFITYRSFVSDVSSPHSALQAAAEGLRELLDALVAI